MQVHEGLEECEEVGGEVFVYWGCGFAADERGGVEEREGDVVVRVGFGEVGLKVAEVDGWGGFVAVRLFFGVGVGVWGVRREGVGGEFVI